MRRVIVISICICSILLFSLTGCVKQDEKSINEKLDAELEYEEELIFKISNKYAKGEYIEDDKIKWEYIKDDIQKINSSWNTLILDLTEVNVANQDIMNFSNDLNNLLISVSQEDDITMIDKLSDMYTKIIIFRQSYSEDKNLIQKNKIKSDVLAVYSLINKNDWETAKAKMNTTIENYKGLMNDINYAEENGYNLNKIYVLLEEYNGAIQTQNYDLVRMKYILAVEEL